MKETRSETEYKDSETLPWSIGKDLSDKSSYYVLIP